MVYYIIRLMKKINFLKLAGAVLICQMAGILGSTATFSAIPTWYRTLSKPFFSPPNWVFGPVWTTLYTMMGISLYIVWQRSKKKCEEGLCYFYVQLALNALWSLIFFGARNLWFGFIIIIFLWVMILATIIKFKKVSKKAAYLLVPYLAWVSFASILNLAVAVLN